MSASVLLSLDVMEGATLIRFFFLFIKFESTFQIIKKSFAEKLSLGWAITITAAPYKLFSKKL